jgi:hypothetical protein
LQQTRFAVRMAAGSGLGAEPVAHYTQGRSKLARRGQASQLGMRSGHRIVDTP